MGWNTRLFFSCTTVAAAAALLSLGAGCNEHQVSFDTATGAVETLDQRNLSGGEKIDLLWVIDNSGSMCRSQELLRNGIDEFVNILGEVNLDFQVGITTSHMLDCSPDNPDREDFSCNLETVALPGHLQSTPQPVPGYDSTCYHPVYGPDDPEVTADPNNPPFVGDPITDRYDPVIANVQAAVDCTTNPDAHQDLLNFDAEWEEDFRCAYNISEPGDDCSDNPAQQDFFPDPADYRPIPKVLRSEDYDSLEEFGADFACASLVGTRGFGLEQSLLAAVTAVSPELTGGAFDEDEQDPSELDTETYPNAGFIRNDAMTGLIFVGDENDCSHDGTLPDSTCGNDVCATEEQKPDQGALFTPDELVEMFKANLATARGVDSINESTILPASFHGRSQLDDPPADACTEDGEDYTIPPTCASDIGVATSGHRFDQFMRGFNTFFPSADPQDPNGFVEGLICSRSGFSEGLAELAEYFKNEVGACYEDVYTCSGFGAECPSSPYGEETEGTCLPYPDHYDDLLEAVQNGDVDGESLDSAIAAVGAAFADDTVSGAADLEARHMATLLRNLNAAALNTLEGNLDNTAEFYCDTGIELRLGIPENSSELALEDTGYCLEDTIGNEPSLPDTCVVDPARYWWDACGDTRNGMTIAWTEGEEWVQSIGGFDLFTRYATIPGEEEADEANGETANANTGQGN